MNKFILLILVMTISYFTAVKPDANFLDTAWRVIVLIEKVEQLCGKKPEKKKSTNREGKIAKDKKLDKK
ncbi:hypothetical protein ACOWPH_31105 (plasmid) [Anabaena sp. PCC 7938]|nr:MULTISPECIES: hypothetical protein [Anabaena]MBY5280385.1 hypothetical protein [Anabaena sp. CCAP 1446/1C]MCM2409480.1 hypothetical protein [Anabaena sp. CCAP 1446/1C]